MLKSKSDKVIGYCSWEERTFVTAILKLRIYTLFHVTTVFFLRERDLEMYMQLVCYILLPNALPEKYSFSLIYTHVIMNIQSLPNVAIPQVIISKEYIYLSSVKRKFQTLHCKAETNYAVFIWTLLFDLLCKVPI